MRPLIIAVALALVVSPAAASQVSDAEIRQAIIKDSIAQYPGPCACPYNSARNGSSCGRRSAYSRPGGYSPLCYSRDVSQQMVDAYRRDHSQ